jgi:hypothetical protein
MQALGDWHLAAKSGTACPGTMSAVHFQKKLSPLIHSLKDILLTIGQWWTRLRPTVN